MELTVEQYDNFVKYALNVDVSDFSREFYGRKFDKYVEAKVSLLRNNFGEFWCGLDNNNKKKYIELVNKYYEDN